MNIDQQIRNELKKAYDHIRKGGGLVEVITPYKLNEAEEKELKESFPFMKDAIITFSVDPSIMAGVIIKYGTKMIDLSLKSELTNLTHRLYESL